MSPRSNNSSPDNKPKRVRRKCTAPGCDNRVVQGGVCVTHGAKRKLCQAPGCSKAVKLAGFCSTHGPSRKKCDYVDPSSGSACARVAVQGGRCLSHGARRRFCAFPGKKVCTKNAVAGGYCKKHHDLVQDASGMLDLQSSPSIKSDGDSVKNNSFCVPVGTANALPGRSVISGASSSSVSDHSSVASSSAATDMLGGGGGVSGQHQHQLSPLSLQYEQHFKSSAPVSEKPAPKKKPPTAMRVSKFPNKPHHKRGLSIFEEMQTVDAIIGMGGEQREPAAVSEGIASVAKQQHKKLKQEPPNLPTQQQLPADSTKTPHTQVTFADGVKHSQEAPSTVQPTSQNPDEVCLQNPSCTCSACRSPTLAIFEQMIQASQKIEQGEIGDERYAGLSPPKLSPSKRPSASSKHSKSVKFPDEDPSSSSSVARKVSNNSFGVGDAPSIPRSRNEDRADGGPASSALASSVKNARDDDDNGSRVNRTVSQDAESPRARYYHYYGYPPPHHHHHPSHFYYHNQHPHSYYYQQPPYPHHHYRQHPPPPPQEAPGTPILSDDLPEASQSSSESRSERRKQQKRLLPKPRGKTLEHLFIPSQSK